MNREFWRRFRKTLLWFCVLIVVSYGLGRLYYRVTGGFTIGNISYALPYDAQWDVHGLSKEEEQQLDSILSAPFHYLGKGCQSYVFESRDGNYVLKFFKYQRFRPQAWLNYISFIPAVDRYRLKKVDYKKKKLESVFTSWKLAYEDLKPETGVVFVHLNKSSHLNKSLMIYDKMGFKHILNIDDFEFMIQKKAKMLCPQIEELMNQGKTLEAQKLIDRLLMMVMSEYRRGYADNDHALMQNTGVIEGKPIHIDVGQFVRNDRVKESKVYNQEIFNKTWKFRKWLETHYPELAQYVVLRLKEIIGESEFALLKPRLNKAAMGVISHQD